MVRTMNDKALPFDTGWRSGSEISLAIDDTGAAPLISTFLGALTRGGIHAASQPHSGCVPSLKPLLRD